MRWWVIIGLLIWTNSVWSQQHIGDFGLQTGDILFQDFDSGLSEAIKEISHSEFSHVGVVLVIDHKTWVLEAVSPVRLTELDSWIARNDRNFYVAKRLKDADSRWTTEKQDELIKEGRKYLGKPYDIRFEWSNDALYCSELVWKVYYEVLGIRVGEIQRLKELDMSTQVVQETLFRLYGNEIPYEEMVVSPQAILDCPLLIELPVSN
ncbi:YiiX family permuted papain-like enzyme [bacterium SCSIO 12741]|nr:YiiX family permuted papain-like enzyme [bacterium SCSIO 12741]